jgi:hypothetical protein
MQQPPKKKVGEMGKPSAEKEFQAAMQKEWESRPQGAPGKTKPETKAEAQARESGNSPEDLKAKARKQIQDQEMMKEKIRQNSKDKSIITKTLRALLNK